jgi:DNA polymerase I-like protein with 3'-5' exonuclease and polymerase domains
MKKQNSESLNVHVGRSPRIIVVTDISCDEVYFADLTMTVPEMKLFMSEAKACGFEREDFIFMNACPPVEDMENLSDGQVGKHVDSYSEEFYEVFDELVEEHDIGMVISLGRWAARQLKGGPVPITKIRGTVCKLGNTDVTYLPLLSPKEVLRFPDRREIFNTDFLQLESLAEVDWSIDEFREAASGQGYKWCLDLTELLENPPEAIDFDTETVGMEFREPGFRVLTAQITRKKGESLVIPLDLDWWNDEEGHNVMNDVTRELPRLTLKLRRKLIAQLKELLENPNVCVSGHNLKYDIHVMRTLGINIANWFVDTIQLAFVVDENMQRKGLDDCARRWLPQFAGYADKFNDETDKSQMNKVNHTDFLEYAGGDTQVGYRLTSVLIRLAQQDSRNWETFMRVQMPALRMFVEMERWGVGIDTEALTALGVTLAEQERNLYSRLLEKVPPALLRKYLGEGKRISFDSADHLIDILFGPDGIRVKDDEVAESGGRPLKPVVFTKGKKPSTSGKQHLPYFENIGFIRDLMEYKQVSKMRSTYVGQAGGEEIVPVKRLKNGDLPKALKTALEAADISVPKVVGRRRTPIESILARAQIQPDGTEAIVVPAGTKGSAVIDTFGNAHYRKPITPTGFWQHIKDLNNPRIYPSFWGHRTVTGRVASSDPNAQNFPKRGPLAKAYRKIFIPTEGYLFAECDLSQAELRVAACMAGEREMLRIYNEDGDIHAATAAAVMGVTEDAFNIGMEDQTPLIEVANHWPGSGEYLAQLAPGKRREVTVADYLDFKRFCAKAVNFGFLYGMGWRKFKTYARTDYKIVFSDEEAEQTRELFFEKYPRLRGWHDAMREFLKEHGYVRALHGSLRRLPNVGSDDDMIVGMSSRQGINAPVQRFASDLALIGAARFGRDADPDIARMILFIHDANIPEILEEYVDEYASALPWYMSSTPLEEWFNISLPVKIVADVATGVNLCDMQKRKDLVATKPRWFNAGAHPPDETAEMQERWQTLIDYGVIIPG